MTRYHFASSFSPLFHYITFAIKKPTTEFGTASLIISIDVDVGSAKLGAKNKRIDDLRIHNFMTERMIGRIEEQTIPLLLDAFDEVEQPVTFAVRGQLAEIENSVLNLILESDTRHEIAAHGYSHTVFTALTEFEAEKELNMISAGMKKYGIVPKSFVFPKNEVSHLPLLEKHGYLSFRGRGGLLKDGMYIRKHNNLFDVHPSLYLGEFYGSNFLKELINQAVLYRSPLHLWFHPWNLGSPKMAAKRITNVLVPLTKYAEKKKGQGVLRFETMRSVAESFRERSTRHAELG